MSPNPGPIAARIIFFAPIGLLFFLVVMLVLGVLKEQSLHPVNYFFLAAAFFAFHLLFAYLVDHISIHLAFVPRPADEPGRYVGRHSLFVARGWPVYTIGLSDEADRPTLMRIARETGGRFFFAATAEELSAMAARLNETVARFNGQG